jgi:hypothetical protein
MIIKRWNGDAFLQEYPKTVANMLFTNDGITSLFDENTKLKVGYLPNDIIDSLHYYATAASTSNLSTQAHNAITDATTNNRSPKGYYWVTSESAGYTANPTTATLISGVYYKTFWSPAPEAQSSDTVSLSAGDWFILTRIAGGDGTTALLAKEVHFATVNNTYTTATNTALGVVKYGASGSVTIGGKIYPVQNDGTGGMGVSVPWTTESHAHGDISYTGTISSAAVTAGNGDLILISDASDSNKIKRSITVGTSTTSFLRNDGTWQTPSYSTLASLGVTATAAELNKLAGIATTATELGYVAGVTSSIQTQLGGKAATSHAHGNITSAGTITGDTSPASGFKLVMTNGSSELVRSAVALGSSTTTFLRNDGSWVTPAGSTYSAAAQGGLNLSGSAFAMNYPLYVATSSSTPVPTVTGSIWFDITP